MTKTFFIVTNYNAEEPELFTDSHEAFKFMLNELKNYGKECDFELEEINEAIQDMKDMYNEGDSDFFEGYLGECQLCCYRKEICI